ncbi:MAG: CDP-alcohol phosphatidyltransferase family protein [Pseudomonadota bacterium]
MLDNRLRRKIDPSLNAIGAFIAKSGLSANSVTWLGFGLGLAAFVAIWQTAYILGLILLLVSRLADGLDGAVARRTGKTDLGGFLDIVLDFAFYGLIPLGFVLADPSNNAVAGAVLLFAFYANGASFLTFALMAEKRGVDEEARGSKSLLYTVGLAEATETILAFVLMCLLPDWFAEIAYAFTAICFVTTAARIKLAYATFRD